MDLVIGSSHVINETSQSDKVMRNFTESAKDNGSQTNVKVHRDEKTNDNLEDIIWVRSIFD